MKPGLLLGCWDSNSANMYNITVTVKCNKKYKSHSIQ